MKKLALDLDRLRVDSFETSPAGQSQLGTVKGHVSGWDCPEEPGANDAPKDLWDTLAGRCASWFICTQLSACDYCLVAP